MTEWDDRFNGHEAVQLLRQLSDLLDAVEKPEQDPRLVFGLERARQAATTITRILDAVDPQLVPPAALERMLPPASNAMSVAQGLASTDDGSQLQQLNAHLDALLDQAGLLLVAAPLLTKGQQRDAATGFRRTAGQLVRGLSDETNELSSRLSDLESRIEKQGGVLSERDTAGAAALERLTNLITEQEGRIAAFQQQFAEGEASRVSSYSATQDEMRTAFATLITEERGAAAGQADELRAAAAQTLEELERHRLEAARLVNAVGQNAFAGGFGVYAQEEQSAANRWRLYSALAILAIAVFGVIYLFTVGTTEFTIQGFWIRAVIIIPLGVFAGYAASQSGRHRKNEVQARNLALQLLALDPYLELLDKGQADAKKLELASRFFAYTADGKADSSDAIGIQQLAELLSKAIDKIK
jgi:hypothetical protein